MTSFDPGLAASLGIRNGLWHYGLMAALSVVVVSAFESVGAILVIALLIFPGATASLLTDRLPVMHLLGVVFSALYAFLGFHLGTWLDASIAGSMVVTAGVIFAAAWICAPRKGLIARARRTRRNAAVTAGGEAEPSQSESV